MHTLHAYIYVAREGTLYINPYAHIYTLHIYHTTTVYTKYVDI